MKKLLLLFALLPLPVYAAEPPHQSLFFTAQEAHDADMLADQQRPGKGDIKLGALIYYGPNDWRMWLQGEEWDPSTSRPNMRVIDVTADHARIAWRDDDHEERQIVLKPNECYQIATGDIRAAP